MPRCFAFNLALSTPITEQCGPASQQICVIVNGLKILLDSFKIVLYLYECEFLSTIDIEYINKKEEIDIE